MKFERADADLPHFTQGDKYLILYHYPTVSITKALPQQAYLALFLHFAHFLAYKSLTDSIFM